MHNLLTAKNAWPAESSLGFLDTCKLSEGPLANVSKQRPKLSSDNNGESEASSWSSRNLREPYKI